MAEKPAPEIPDTKPKLTPIQSLIQFLKFLIFSAGAGIIQFGTFTLLSELTDWTFWPCHLPALVLSVLFNFTINRRFTFKSVANIPAAMIKVLCYYLVFTPASVFGGQALMDLGWNRYIVEIGAMVINFVTEFLFWRFFVFGKTINTNDLAEKERQAAKAKNTNP